MWKIQLWQVINARKFSIECKPEDCIMNWSWADNKLVRSGFFSQHQRNIVVNKIAARKKENCPPQNLPTFPPFISQCTLQAEIYLWVAAVLPLQHKWEYMCEVKNIWDIRTTTITILATTFTGLSSWNYMIEAKTKNHVKITTQALKSKCTLLPEESYHDR